MESDIFRVLPCVCFACILVFPQLTYVLQATGYRTKLNLRLPGGVTVANEHRGRRRDRTSTVLSDQGVCDVPASVE